MYSVGYPLYSSAHGAESMEKLRQSELVDEEQFRKIAYGTAEKFLRLKA